jgi:predicted RNase H-like nuclease (RuvC/YqgF family)
MLQYSVKKKRIRDPNLPPPPTLLGQVKELRLTRENLEILASRISELEAENHKLHNQIQNLESRISRIINHIKNGKKS